MNQDRSSSITSPPGEEKGQPWCRRMLAAVTHRWGAKQWEQVGQLGSDAVLAAELARRCRSVTDYDLGHEPSPGGFELVFAPEAFSLSRKRADADACAHHLSRSVRAGGMVALQFRPPRDVSQKEVRRLLNFLNGRHRLHLVHEEYHSDEIIALYTKSPPGALSPRLKRLFPASLRRAYRNLLYAGQLVPLLERPTPQTLCRWSERLVTILEAKSASTMDIAALASLDKLAEDLLRDRVAGDFVECGVGRGGSAALLGSVLRESELSRRLWLFDSFLGLPHPTERDGQFAPPFVGEMYSGEEEVKRTLARVAVPPSCVRIVAGWFQETFPHAAVERVALLHIDADWYESIRLCLEHFYDRLAAGAVVILDDYDAWPGCKAAFEDFCRERSLQLRLERHAQAPPYFRKPA